MTIERSRPRLPVGLACARSGSLGVVVAQIDWRCCGGLHLDGALARELAGERDTRTSMVGGGAAKLRGVASTRVWVEDWQMQCCGDPFSVGDTVVWTASRNSGPLEELEAIFEPGSDTSADWIEDHHVRDDTEPVSGTVRAIHRVFYRYRLVDRMVMPVRGSAVLKATSHATGWEEEEAEDVRFLGYVVTLDQTADSRKHFPQPAEPG